jgi:hypothetical protein
MSQLALTPREEEFSQTFKEKANLIQELDDEIKELLDKRERAMKELTDDCKRWGKALDADVSKSKVLTTKMDKRKDLRNIFTPSFLNVLVREFKVVPKTILTFKDIQANPWVCNFPREMTTRSQLHEKKKDENRNGSAPCKRHLKIQRGKDAHVYFCAIPQHEAYAKNLGLPITESDLRRQNLPVPSRPTDEELEALRSKVVHHLPHAEWYGEHHENPSPKPTRVPKKVEKVGKVGKAKKRKLVEEEDSLAEIEIWKCMHVHLMTDEGCVNEAIHKDPFDRNAPGYCEYHMSSPLDILETLEEMEELTQADERLYMDLKRLQQLDLEIEAHDAETSSKWWKDKVKARYKRAKELNLGTREDWLIAAGLVFPMSEEKVE